MRKFSYIRKGVMLLATDLIAIVIALVGCLTMMGVFFKQNLELRRENQRLIDAWDKARYVD
jgi:uncharacterized integral membrane protein